MIKHKIIKYMREKNLWLIFSIFFGGLLTIVFIYIRFLRERISGHLDSSYTSIKFWLILCSIIVFFFLLLYTIIFPFYVQIVFNEIDTNKSLKNQKYVQWFFKLLAYFTESLNVFWTPIMNKFINLFPEQFVPFVSLIIKIDPYYSKFAILFYFLPPAIIAFIFFVETVIYQEYTYFAYSIFLMIFPVIWRSLLYLLRYFCEQMYASRFSKTLKEIGFNQVTHEPIFIWSENASKYGISDDELQSYDSLFLEIYMMHKYQSHLKTFNSWKFHLFASKNKYFLQIFVYTCFFIAACSKLAFLH